jgi:esterase/lipase superfamily enzyme
MRAGRNAMNDISGSRLVSIAILAGLIARPVIGAAKDKDKTHDPLMPTPVIYSKDNIDPFLHLPPEMLTTEMKVFYATNRNSESKDGKAQYGKKIDDVMSVGVATVQFGEKDTTWAQLDKASKARHQRDPEVPMYLKSAEEFAQFDVGQATGDGAKLTPAQQKFVDGINAQLKVVDDKQILLYVHGAKFTFESSLTQTAEVNHFAGRDLVSVGYAWPTHTDIIAYGFGVDVKRADHSSPILGDLIELLAAHTDADAINLLSWSAGARIAARAVTDLRKKNSDLTSEQLRKKFRLKVLLFAAPDVPTVDFIAQLPSMHDMTDRVVVTQSDDDGTLKFADKVMKGGTRAGMYLGTMDADEYKKLATPLDRLEILNVSAFKDERGFDITGHHYWFEHPWVSSDVLITIRTDLAPADRGLEPTGQLRYWGFKKDYPQDVGAILDKLGIKSW